MLVDGRLELTVMIVYALHDVPPVAFYVVIFSVIAPFTGHI